MTPLEIVDKLNEMFPNAVVELDHKNTFELLVAVVLSAQTTDVAVNKVTPALFDKYPTPEAMMKAKEEDVMELIKTIGLYKNKSRHLVKLATQLVENHGGVVPSDRKSLESLAGVGRKTANVILSNAFGIPALAVDTHVKRVSHRLGLTDVNDSVLVVEKKLNKIFPKEKWLQLHHQLIFFGRYFCKAKTPECHKCPFYSICTDEIKFKNSKK